MREMTIIYLFMYLFVNLQVGAQLILQQRSSYKERSTTAPQMRTNDTSSFSRTVQF